MARVKFGFRKTPDGYFLMVIPAEILDVLREKNPEALQAALIEEVGQDVFIKVKSRRIAREIAEKAELLLSRENP